MKPIIGIITRPELSTEKNKTMCIYDDIRTSIIKSGGIPIGIMPLNKDLNDFDSETLKLIDKCDGVVFQGGDSFHKYDEEWRMITGCIMKPPVMMEWIPSGIILGLRMDVAEENLVVSMAKEAGIKNIYKSYINAQNKLDAYPLKL